MIFQRALRRELISTAGAVFTTLFTISITFMLIKVLGQAAGGKAASEDVIVLIGFTALTNMPVILLLTSFISVLMVVMRSYQDSEMVVWFASGLSLSRWIRPILGFVFPIIVLTALLSLIAAPWAISKSAEFRERFDKRSDIASVAPGKFHQSTVANRVFFFEGVSGDAMKVKKLFVNTQKDGRDSVIVAEEGLTELDSRGDKFLVMQKGRRYDGSPTQPDFQVMEFERYTTIVSRQPQALIGDKSARAMSTLDLIEKNTNSTMGELLWRIALPLMCMLLSLLAIPLSFVNPRAGRSATLIVALLLGIVYLNMVNLFQAEVVQGRLPFMLAWWPIHLITVLVIGLMFAWRLTVNSRLHPLALWASCKRTKSKKPCRGTLP
jgi:lipopolysaccharide export system permease protein